MPSRWPSVVVLRSNEYGAVVSLPTVVFVVPTRTMKFTCATPTLSAAFAIIIPCR